MKYVEFNKKVNYLVNSVSLFDENPDITANYVDNLDIHSELITIYYTMYNLECTIYYSTYSDNYSQEFTCSYGVLDKNSENNKYIDTKVTEFDSFEQLVDYVSTQHIINTLFS